MTHAGPLPGVGTRPSLRPSRPAVIGRWRGVVERVAPLAVSVPGLAGQGQALPRIEAEPGLVLAVGTRVWVVCIEGDPGMLLVAGLREAAPPPSTKGDALGSVRWEGKASTGQKVGAAAGTVIFAGSAAGAAKAGAAAGAVTFDGSAVGTAPAASYAQSKTSLAWASSGSTTQVATSWPSANGFTSSGTGLTVPVAGVYLVHLGINTGPSPTTRQFLDINANGVLVARVEASLVTGGSTDWQVTGLTPLLAAGALLTFARFQNSGSSITTNVTLRITRVSLS